MEVQTLASRYIESWNELDAIKRTQMLRDVLTEDASYHDPQMTGRGPDGISEMIGRAQEQFAGLSFRLSDPPLQAHGAFARFSWVLGPVPEHPVVGGTDMVQLYGGKMQSIVGFIDFAPHL